MHLHISICREPHQNFELRPPLARRILITNIKVSATCCEIALTIFQHLKQILPREKKYFRLIHQG